MTAIVAQFPRPYSRDGRIVTTSVMKSKRKFYSALGRKYDKGTLVVRMESNRCTGEVFTLTKKDVKKLLKLMSK